MSDLKNLPSIGELIQNEAALRMIATYGRPLALEAMRSAVDEARKRFPLEKMIPETEALLERANQLLCLWTTPTLQPVINATGVVLHTNLGRAPLSRSAIEAMQAVSLGYSNLEYDLQQGRRGSRLVHAEDLLKRLTGAEAALVVNNNAAAVLLSLTALARRRRVVIARSQLIEIGGGFRIPDVMKQSGAKLVEVGTTNRVHRSDFEQAIAEGGVALMLRAHRSNFQIIGFTTEPNLAEMVAMAHHAGIPLLDDLGSGSLLDTSLFGLGHEPMVQESIQAGADLVCFSGDKLLGGPQAGVILGRADLIAKLKKHPLARAIRADKLCLAALTATLLHYLKDEAVREIPTWRMIAMPAEQARERAQKWASQLHSSSRQLSIQVIEGKSTVGGGSLPGETLPTYLLSIGIPSPNKLLARLRSMAPPIIARTEEDCVVLDPRTVLPEQDPLLLANLQQALVG